MVSRREVLAGGAGVLAGLAGCTGSSREKECIDSQNGWRIHVYQEEPFELEEGPYVKSLEDSIDEEIEVSVEGGNVYIDYGKDVEVLNDAHPRAQYKVGEEDGKTVQRQWTLEGVEGEKRNGWYYLETKLSKEGWFSKIPEEDQGLCDNSEELVSLLE